MDLLNAGLCLAVLNSQSIKFIFNYPMINLSRSVVVYVSTLYSYVLASRPDCTTCRYVHIDEKNNNFYLKKLVMDCSLFVQKEYSTDCHWLSIISFKLLFSLHMSNNKIRNVFGCCCVLVRRRLSFSRHCRYYKAQSSFRSFSIPFPLIQFRLFRVPFLTLSALTFPMAP